MSPERLEATLTLARRVAISVVLGTMVPLIGVGAASRFERRGFFPPAISLVALLPGIQLVRPGLRLGESAEIEPLIILVSMLVYTALVYWLLWAIESTIRK